jgi:hypothetical protein
MLNEAASRSRSAAHVGGESIGGIMAAYDNTTTAKYIRDLAIRGRAERTQQSYSRYVSDLSLHAIITVRQN